MIRRRAPEPAEPPSPCMARGCHIHAHYDPRGGGWWVCHDEGEGVRFFSDQEMTEHPGGWAEWFAECHAYEDAHPYP